MHYAIDVRTIAHEVPSYMIGTETTTLDARFFAKGAPERGGEGDRVGRYVKGSGVA